MQTTLVVADSDLPKPHRTPTKKAPQFTVKENYYKNLKLA